MKRHVKGLHNTGLLLKIREFNLIFSKNYVPFGYKTLRLDD